jgi:hypothetical protein
MVDYLSARLDEHTMSLDIGRRLISKSPRSCGGISNPEVGSSLTGEPWARDSPLDSAEHYERSLRNQ